MCGDTQVNSNDLRSAVSRLGDYFGCKTGFETQFEVLMHLSSFVTLKWSFSLRH